MATLLRTGLAKNAEEAYDIIAAGARNGLNRNEDLLDTLTEYPVVLRKLGLSGSESLGLINQGLRAGARNTDVLADALKEFQIRATDGSDSSASGFQRLGLDAEEMTAKIARGGADARDGLDQVLRKLRETEDPVQRNAAAVELFGTKAEDLGDALFSLDLSTAVDQLGQVNGAAQRMFDTLANNDAAKLETAKRNIETAVEGIQGALAAGFSEPISEASEWISENRGPVLQFFRDLANGALDAGVGFVEAAASGTEAFGEFVSGPLADAAEGVAVLLRWLQQYEQADGVQKMVDDMRGFDDQTQVAADNMRTNLFGAIEGARDRLNEFADPAINMAFLSDAAQRTASAVAELGSEHSTLHEQITNVVGAMREELEAAAAAGESQDQLTERYNTTTQALVDQMVQMGYTEEQARRIIGTYGAVPELVKTTFEANTAPADTALQAFIDRWNNRTLTVDVVSQARIGGGEAPRVGPLLPNARGNVLTPMSGRSATVVPPNTWRVVGDRMDVSEIFAPLDGSARSWSIIAEGIRRMPGVMPMAEGGVLGPASAGVPSVSIGEIAPRVDLSPSEVELRRMIDAVVREWVERNFGQGGLG